MIFTFLSSIRHYQISSNFAQLTLAIENQHPHKQTITIKTRNTPFQNDLSFTGKILLPTFVSSNPKGVFPVLSGPGKPDEICEHKNKYNLNTIMDIIEIILKCLIPTIIQGLFQLAMAKLKHCFPNLQPPSQSHLATQIKKPGVKKHRLSKSNTAKKKRCRKH
ncbi:hypothetical protein [Pedobacter rhizosphaerae]|uniref:Uncharacterized protein n=1 Tax=Pedobacter rhizosphaerae TaxID=390241 RepID=A0A1H9VP71_9SPHI|nr:hypothetical protein [Pedobacter rhizosphaerae]SES23359.1 hypothetical protein SAMN04488023_14611 [Pedobacter rhizosphaerae]